MDKIKAIVALMLSAPVRKAVYGLIGAGFTFAFALGFFTEADQALVETFVDNAYQLLTAASSFMAMWKTADPEPAE